MRTAIFVGSFDPFTIGHDDIARRALALVDRLVIGVGVNERKACSRTAEERISAIQQLYAEEARIEVMGFSDLTVTFAKRVGAQFVIKGVRSVKDFEYEREQAEINRRLTGLETILLCAQPQLASVSSSLVRELEHFGQDVAQFLP
jgi:pantetheine-phosphate adenylyltransferase